MRAGKRACVCRSTYLHMQEYGFVVQEYAFVYAGILFLLEGIRTCASRNTDLLIQEYAFALAGIRSCVCKNTCFRMQEWEFHWISIGSGGFHCILVDFNRFQRNSMI